MEMTHIVNSLVIIGILYILWVNISLLRELRSKTFLWMVAGVLYGLAVRIWIEIDAWVPEDLYPQSQWGAAIMGGMYLGLALGFYGLRQGLLEAKRRREMKYGRRKDDVMPPKGP